MKGKCHVLKMGIDKNQKSKNKVIECGLALSKWSKTGSWHSENSMGYFFCQFHFFNKEICLFNLVPFQSCNDPGQNQVVAFFFPKVS
jgi:hypothetical protein